MGLWEFLKHPGGKARGWDALPAPVVTERKSSWTIDDYRAVIVSPLVHGPGLSDRPASDNNSAVYACLQVLATAIAEPELKVFTVQQRERVAQEETPLGDLLAHPNPHFSMDTLLAYLSNCLHIDGNGYWRKLRAGNELTGNVVELWPISPTRIEPRTQNGSGDFISSYRYYVRPGVFEDIDPTNIIHFRTGLRDGDHRFGDAPLKRLAREVSSDEQATRYADRLLANLAINGLSLEFDKERDAVSPDQAAELKARIQATYGGDNVGAVSVLSPGAKLVSHGFSPEQMDMKTLHRVPEERIAAVLGVPAIVAGLGAGLDHATYSNVAQAREAFTEVKLIPLWRQLAATITMSLVPDFTSDRSATVEFDISDVRALGDDQNALATRLKTYVDAGILTIDEARAEIGLDPKPEQADPAQPTLPDGITPAMIEAMQQQQQRSRPTLIRTLPLARKALDDLPDGLGQIRESAAPDWQAALESFLASQSRAMQSRLRAGADTAEGLIVEGDATLLGETLAPLQRALLDDVTRLVMAELGIQFDLDDPATREYLRRAGTNIVGINETTRSAVRRELIAGQHAGEGIEQLAARLRDLPAFNDARARVVARTELGHSQIEAAYQGYRASGVVVGITILDGDFDAECAARNGTKLSLNAAASAPRLLHPNCTASWSPIVDAAELDRSA